MESTAMNAPFGYPDDDFGFGQPSKWRSTNRSNCFCIAGGTAVTLASICSTWRVALPLLPFEKLVGCGQIGGHPSALRLWFCFR